MSSPDISAASSCAVRPEPSIRSRAASLLLAPFVLPALTTCLLLLAWEGATRAFAIPSFMLPSPSAILSSFGAVGLSRWAEHVGATFRVAMLGYAVSILVAVPLAIALARSEVLSRALYPILVVVQSTPIVAVAPIIIVVMGAGDLPRIVITCLITFFPIVVSTTTGLMATPPELVELSRSLRAPAWREITQIRLPFAVPYIFSALKISITLAVIGAVGVYQVSSKIQDRVANFVDPVGNYDVNGFQLSQALFGMSYGGVTGTGLGEGYPYLVPVAHSDFILAAIGEELGLIGLAAVLVFYLILASRGFKTAMLTRDSYGKLVAAGLSLTLIIQVFVVTGGVSRLLPMTGLTTPFLAHGGSSLLANYILLAILLRISHSARAAMEVSADGARGSKAAALASKRKQPAPAEGEGGQA